MSCSFTVGGRPFFTQINDTHLHALMQRWLVRNEVHMAHDQRKNPMAEGEYKTPRLKRWDICRLVSTVWQTINHAQVAEKGYAQTGPTMPLAGPVERDNVYNNLMGVIDKIDPPPPGGLYAGVDLRDAAVQFVKDGYAAGKWTTWADAHLLTDEHDGEDDPTPEGMAAYSFHTRESDEEHDSGADDDYDAAADAPRGGGGSSLTASAAPAPPMRSGVGSPPAVARGGVDAPVARGDDGVPPAGAPDAAAKLAAARQVVMEDCIERQDDTTMKRLRDQMRTVTRDKHSAATPAATVLSAHAHAEEELAKKRRLEKREADRLTANEAEVKKAEAAREKPRRHGNEHRSPTAAMSTSGDNAMQPS
jgi:hypothetical protein